MGEGGVGCAHPWSHHVRCTDNIINAQFNVIFKFQSGICNQMYRSQQSQTTLRVWICKIMFLFL